MAAQREGHRLAGRLKSGMWVAAQDRTADETYWIGQVYAVPGAKASDPCVHKKVEGRTEWLAGVQFDRGDCAVAVKWWQLTADDPEERVYEGWEPTQAEITAFGIETPNGPYFLWSTRLSCATLFFRWTAWRRRLPPPCRWPWQPAAPGQWHSTWIPRAAASACLQMWRTRFWRFAGRACMTQLRSL